MPTAIGSLNYDLISGETTPAVVRGYDRAASNKKSYVDTSNTSQGLLHSQPTDSVGLAGFSLPQLILSFSFKSDAELFFEITEKLYMSGHRKVADRLNQLYKFTVEEDETISIASVQQFAAFLTSRPNVLHPSLVVTPDRTVRAIWQKSPRTFVKITFGERHLVKYVMFIEGDDGVARLAGEDLLRQVLAHIELRGPTGLVFDR